MATSIIVPGVKVEGKISGESDIKVEGTVVGEIDLVNSIYIAKGGVVEADIKALNVFIAGEFKGNIEARELIQISPGGKVKGEIKAPYLSIEKGAVFTGSIDMGGAGEAPAAEPVESAPVREEEEVKTETAKEPESVVKADTAVSEPEEVKETVAPAVEDVKKAAESEIKDDAEPELSKVEEELGADSDY